MLPVNFYFPREAYFMLVYSFSEGQPGGRVVVGDFDYNTSTAQPGPGLGLSLAIMCSLVAASIIRLQNHYVQSISTSNRE